MNLRVDLYNYLNGQFAPLVAATLPAGTTGPTAYDPAIDQALRALGIAEAALSTAQVTDAQTSDTIVLSEYYSLLRFSRALSLQVNVQLGHPRIAKQRSQLFDHVHLLLTEARTELINRGYLGQGWDIERLELDFLEPAQDF